MNQLKHFICPISAALLLATAACTKDELADGNRLPEGQYSLEIARITLGVEGGEAQPWGAPQTRVSEIADGTGSVFDAGDRFAVQIDGKEEVGTYTVQDDHTVKAETPLYWSDTGEHTVTAWYPAKSGTLDLGNQSQSLAYLLYATGTGDYRHPSRRPSPTNWSRCASRLRTMHSAKCRASSSIPTHSVLMKKARPDKARKRAG